MRPATSPAGSEHGRPPADGFTLVELLLVLAIGGLMVAVVPPLLSAALPGLQMKGSAREVAAAMRFARDHAVIHQSEAAVHLDLEANSYTVTGRARKYRIPERLEVLLDTVQSELTGERSGAIRFFPDGTSTGGRVTLAFGERSYKVDVDWLTGRVVIAE